MRRRFFLLGLVLLLCLPVFAHSNLQSIEPPVDRTFASAPPELRLTFTESLEAEFSRMDVYDNHGTIVPLPPASVEGEFSLVLDTSSLGTGVYTVAWRVVSATDGHPSEGSFPLRIGSNAVSISAVMPQNAAVDTTGLRAFNLLSLALLMGAVTFPLLIWNPAPILRTYLVFAWLLVGLSGLALALMQAAIVAGSWDNAFNALPPLLTSTRFGFLWGARMALWLILGLFIFSERNPITQTASPNQNIPASMPSVQTIQLIFVLALLLVQSLMSHASGALDSWAAIAADWLHLVAMGAWLGGLAAFFLSMASLRKDLAQLSTITARFSNLARLAVAMLILTGTYSAWLHVGSLDALLNTAYGQALTLKLALFLPVLGIGAINLLLTARGLAAGDFAWSKRLRWLLGVEIALTFGILAAVGTMTSVEPARTAYQAPTAPVNQQFFEMQVADGMMIHLTIEPNSLGTNRFYVDLLNEEMSAPINDASAVQVNFGDTTSAAVLQGGGRYLVSGELQHTGENNISLSISRPNATPTNLEFQTYINPPTTSRLASATVLERATALLLTGLIGLALTVYLLSRAFPQKWLFGTVSLLATGIISFSGLALLLPANIPSDAPISMIVGGEKPYLITTSGAILQPSADGYSTLPLDAHAYDLYRQSNGTLWVATDSGLYRDEGGLWTVESPIPENNIVSTHGFILALGDSGIYRIEEGNVLHDSRNLDLPLPAPAHEFVMLSNHTHVLLIGTAVYSTTSVGLGWTDLAAPAPIERIGNDEDGKLLALTAEGFYTWDWQSSTWSERTGLPTGVTDWEIFNGELYLLAEGQVYRGAEAIDLAGEFVDIAYQYPDSLWLLEHNGNLWRQRLGTDSWERE